MLVLLTLTCCPPGLLGPQGEDEAPGRPGGLRPHHSPSPPPAQRRPGLLPPRRQHGAQSQPGAPTFPPVWLPAPRGHKTKLAESKSNQELEATVTDSMRTGRRGKEGEAHLGTRWNAAKVQCHHYTKPAGQTLPEVQT